MRKMFNVSVLLLIILFQITFWAIKQTWFRLEAWLMGYHYQMSHLDIIFDEESGRVFIEEREF